MEQIEEKELHAEQTSGLRDIFFIYIYINWSIKLLYSFAIVLEC